MRDLDKLVGKGLSFWVILHLIVLNLSWMVVLAIPMGVLFSSLMTFGNLTSTFEISAMKSGGMSFLQMISPVLISSMILFGFLLWFNDRILPESNHQAKILMIDINRKKPTFSLESGQFSTQIENYTILARKVDSLSNGLSGVTIYDLSNSKQTNTISADSGYVVFIPQMNKLRFWLFNGEILQVVPFEQKNYKKINFGKLEMFLDAKGFNLERTNEAMVSRSDREMRIRDMQIIVDEANKYINDVEDNIRRNLTRPSRCPLGMIVRRGNFGISAAISLGFYIFYWACLIGGEKLADRGYISPFLSMWGGNILIILFGIIILLKVANENSLIFRKFVNSILKKSI
jgi:lipopolysaccharide export system permease protein